MAPNPFLYRAHSGLASPVGSYLVRDVAICLACLEMWEEGNEYQTYSKSINLFIKQFTYSSHLSTIGIGVLVLEALWLTVLKDRIKLF
ncbi:hypothetical protein TNCV_484101 [Trichonephila clavipes]|nr:hypothetical protein TNCV_484101 [Trichonephila clavipes]